MRDRRYLVPGHLVVSLAHRFRNPIVVLLDSKFRRMIALSVSTWGAAPRINTANGPGMNSRITTDSRMMRIQFTAGAQMRRATGQNQQNANQKKY